MNEEQSTKLDIALRIVRCTRPEQLVREITPGEASCFEWEKCERDHTPTWRKTINHRRLTAAAVDYIAGVLDEQRTEIEEQNSEIENPECDINALNDGRARNPAEIEFNVNTRLVTERNTARRDNEELTFKYVEEQKRYAQLLQQVMDLKEQANEHRTRIADLNEECNGLNEENRALSDKFVEQVNANAALESVIQYLEARLNHRTALAR